MKNKIYAIPGSTLDASSSAMQLSTLKSAINALAARSGETVHFNYLAAPSPLGDWPTLYLECSEKFIEALKSAIKGFEPREATPHPHPSITFDREENLGKNPNDWRYKKPQPPAGPKR